MNEAVSRPRAVKFEVSVTSENFREFVSVFIACLGKMQIPLSEWWSERTDSAKQEDLEDMIKSLPSGGSTAAEQNFVGFRSDGIVGDMRYFPSGSSVSYCTASLRRVVRKQDSLSQLVEFQSKSAAMVHSLMRSFSVYAADLTPEQASMPPIPFVPLVEKDTHLVITNRDEVEHVYDDPRAFWNAGWKVLEKQGRQHLLVRGLNLLGGPEYFECIAEGQWAMARAAKPNRNTYEFAGSDPTYNQIFNAGKARLQSVGYFKLDQLLEYSCVIEKDEHVQGWEIFALRTFIMEGKSAEGWPVKTVRVVFLERWMAMQEKRPLLDIGCSVWFYDDKGELQQMTE